MFRAWQFQLKVRADLRHGTTALEKAKLLKELLSAHTEHTRPLRVCVIGVVVFCGGSLLSLPSGSDGLVSIELHRGARVCSNEKCHTTVHNDELDRFRHMALMATSPGWLDQRQGVHVQYA